MSLRVAGSPASWGIEPPEPVRDPPWQRVLEEIALAGYEGVELGPLGYLPTASAELRERLGSHGLALPAGFVMEPFSDLSARARIEQVTTVTCRLLEACGASVVILIDALCPRRSATAGRSDAACRLTPAERSQMTQAMRRSAAIAAELGLRACVHPHVGTHLEFEDEVEALLQETEAQELGLCIDTGHLTYAGADPVQMLRRYGRRVSYLHLKDIDAGRLAEARERRLSFQEAVAGGIFRPLGEGCVDYPALAVTLAEVGYEGWATVEQDRLPDSSSTPMQEAAQSLAFLRSLGLAH